jgi:hypothetical protein
MNTILYLNKTSLIQKIFTFSLLIIGLMLIINNYIFYGIIFSLIGIFIFSSRGLEFNFEENTYREFLKIFGIHIGTWISYPEIEYISVFKTRILDDDYPQNKTYSDIIKINLFYNQNQFSTIFHGEKTECFRIAEILKSKLNVEIFDAT